jgi:hypothetical protein
VLLFPFFQRSSGFACPPFVRPGCPGFETDCKGMSLYNFYPNFSAIFRRFVGREPCQKTCLRTITPDAPEGRQTVRSDFNFLKWVAKVAMFAYSTKFFFRFPFPLNHPHGRRTIASFKADGKDTTSIFTIKVFLQRTFRFAPAAKAALSKRVAKIGRRALLPNIFERELFTFA